MTGINGQYASPSAAWRPSYSPILQLSGWRARGGPHLSRQRLDLHLRLWTEFRQRLGLSECLLQAAELVDELYLERLLARPYAALRNVVDLVNGHTAVLCDNFEEIFVGVAKDLIAENL